MPSGKFLFWLLSLLLLLLLFVFRQKLTNTHTHSHTHSFDTLYSGHDAHRILTQVTLPFASSPPTSRPLSRGKSNYHPTFSLFSYFYT